MNILAVIPARAGSKGVPNKNIRVIAGYPMIYYAIKNAISSKYISKVIVTTDSEEIRTISRQMGVICHWRREELCRDDVTLDSVIYDAIPEGINWDYIVTMQPTSPTLSAETLDKAIEYTIANNIDTVISAINRPHLAWSDLDGKKIPLYKERKNRQYLPAHYMETGAFVISKGNCVTASTRIGSRVDIYELQENEAIDVDDFLDLMNASFFLDKEKIAIYVNGNEKMGMGHIYRALELADDFYSKPDIYYDTNITEDRIFGNTTHNVIPINGTEDLLNRCRKEKYTIFINDILDTDLNYMERLRKVIPNSRIINFEDIGEGSAYADVVFNALYPDSVEGNTYSGYKYYISNRKFMFFNPICISEKVSNVFICFGGADPSGYTERLLNIISQSKYKGINFTVVIGRAKKIVTGIEVYSKCENIEILYDVNNMPELMSKCDIAVTSRGRTSYELAILGIPTIAMAQNAIEEKHEFVCSENGFEYLGLNPDNEEIEEILDKFIKSDKNYREKIQKKMLEKDLRSGRKRVITIINNG